MQPSIKHPIPLDADFKAWMLSMPLVTIDFETYYDDKYSLRKMTMIEYVQHEQFKAQGVSIRVDKVENGALVRGECEYYEDVAKGMEFLRTLDKWVLVAQNTKFEGYILHYHYNIHPTVYADTKSMSKGLWPFQSASLENLAKRLWPNREDMRKGNELVASKGVRDWNAEMHELIGHVYCNQDVFLTAEAFWEMFNEYPTEELEIIHITCRMFCHPTMRTDHEILKQALESERIERQKLLTDALAIIDKAIKQKGLDYWNACPKEAKKQAPLDKKILTSRNRFIKLMAEIFDRPLPMKTNPKGKLTEATGKNDPEFIQYMEENRDLARLFEAKMAWASSQSSSRARRMIDFSKPERGCEIPIPLGYYNAHTGRFSGEEKINMQNLQRNSPHRLSLYAPHGYLTFVCDSSNIEARVLACIAGQWELIEAFRLKKDVYALFASDVVGYEVNKNDHKDERNMGKVCVLGLGYSMGWLTLQRTFASGPMGMDPMDIEDALAQKMVNTYRSVNYAIKAYWKQADNHIATMMMLDDGEAVEWGCLKVIRNGIVLPNGMKLSYPGLKYSYEHEGYVYWNGMYWKKLYGGSLTENIVQALARIIVVSQMVQIDRHMQQWGGWITMQVHDENIGVLPDEESTNEEYYQTIENIMRQSPSWLPELPLDAEGGYAANYSK